MLTNENLLDHNLQRHTLLFVFALLKAPTCLQNIAHSVDVALENKITNRSQKNVMKLIVLSLQINKMFKNVLNEKMESSKTIYSIHLSGVFNNSFRCKL